MDARLTEALAIIERMCVEHDEYKTICELHVREHDVTAQNNFCTCTLCHRTQAILGGATSCSVCGFTADGKHNGVYYCARCLEREEK